MGAREPDIAELQAREAIRAVIHRYARSVDRLDLDAVRACYHADGRDSRPPLFDGDADAFIAWVRPTLEGMDATTHFVGDMTIAVNGARAGVETYYLAMLRSRRDGKLFHATRAGRYLDAFSRRDGVWAIDRRQAITDWSRIETLVDDGDALLGRFMTAAQPGAAETRGRRDRDDPSYAALAAPFAKD